MAKNSVKRVAKIIAKLYIRRRRSRSVLYRVCGGRCVARKRPADRRVRIYPVSVSTDAVEAGRVHFLNHGLPRFLRGRCRALFSPLFVAVVLASTTTVVSGQSADPCPPSDADPGNVTENLIKGTMRYHEWALEVLEEVTASVSGRMQSPEGADSNSITVFMDIVADGEIDQLAVEQGSGNSAFDEEFLQAIQSLAPFSIDTDYMQECSLERLALSIKWLNGGSLTEIRSQN